MKIDRDSLPIYTYEKPIKIKPVHIVKTLEQKKKWLWESFGLEGK